MRFIRSVVGMSLTENFRREDITQNLKVINKNDSILDYRHKSWDHVERMTTNTMQTSRRKT